MDEVGSIPFMEDDLAPKLGPIFILLLFTVPVTAGIFSTTSDKEALREAVHSQNWPIVAQQVDALLKVEKNDDQLDLYRLLSSMALSRQNKTAEIIKLLEDVKKESPYYAWAQLFLARSAYLAHDNGLLENTLKKLDSFPLKGELNTEKKFYEAYLQMENNKWKEAEKILKKIEKPSRGTDLYAAVLMAKALVESYTQKVSAVCRTIKILYVREPKHSWFDNSAPEIRDIPLGGKRISCAVSEKEFSERRKTLNLAGDFERSTQEMISWFKLAKTDLKKQKIVMAQQRMAEGHPEDSVKLLLSLENSSSDVSILLPLSFAAARAGDMKMAIDSSLTVNRILGLQRQGTMALYQAAAWSYQMRDYDRAENLFKKLRVGMLSKSYRKEVLWYQGWLRYLKGDFARAEQGFRSLQRSKRGRGKVEGSDRIQYWLAMSLMRQGKTEKARVLFQKLGNKKGMNYYAFLAQERMKQLPSRNSTALAMTKDETDIQPKVVANAPYMTPYADNAPRPSEQEAEVMDETIDSGTDDESTLLAEENSAAMGEGEKSPDLADAAEEDLGVVDLFSQTEANQKLERAKAFWSVGLEDLARKEVNDLERYSRGFDLFRKLADEYRQMGLYNKLAVMAQNFAGRANFGANRFIYESMYPRAYADQVEKVASELNVAQGLIWGIMKAESMYRPWVKSPVGALGLMQVMPTTGQRLAEMMDYKKFTPGMLLQPSEAIRFGAKYLERLGKKFDRSVQLVAAAYNAGPHRVSQWLYYFGYMQMDEWVEHIPFLETRNYVKRVTVNYMAYNELYGKSLGGILALVEPVPVQVAGAPETKETWE